MANEVGQPTALEIADKFCTEMLCNALICDGCPVQAILHAAQPALAADLLPCGHESKMYVELSHLNYGCAFCAAINR